MLKVLLEVPKPGDFRTDMSNSCHYSCMGKKKALLSVLLLQKLVDNLEGLIGLNVKNIFFFIGFYDGLVVQIHYW